MAKEKSTYQIGLDLGVGSIGWAVVDENNKLVRRRGQNLWGVRLFDGAKSAEERRLFRRQRRTINKRTWRLNLLKNELRTYVLKEDPKFFERLAKSHTKPEQYFLFDGKYNDTTYMREFPTIFHVRVALHDEKKCQDYLKRGIYYRLLYLACHDILKTRGNFLSSSSLSGSEGNSIKSINESIQKLVENLKEIDESFDIDITFIKQALSNHISGKEKINARKSDKATTFLKAILGYKFDLNKIMEFSDEKLDYDFNSETWEETLTGDEVIDGILFNLFEIYRSIRLNVLIGEHKSLSYAKVAIYQTHKRDLAKLKKDIKKIDKALNSNYYEELFLIDDKNKISYTNYVGKLLKDGIKKSANKKTSRDDLIKKLESIKKQYEDKTGDTKLLQFISNDGFLVKPTNKDNRLIPYQLHFSELENILKIFQNLTNTEASKEQVAHIKQLLKFKVPYFAGPLSNHEGDEDSNYWLVKHHKYKDVKVTPYNFNEVVNKRETNKAFIGRMLRSCTYIPDENCVQQETILYQTYLFYNTINKVKINDTFLNKEQKQVLFDNLKTGKTLTKSRIISILGLPKNTDFTGFSKTDDEKPLQISLSAVKKFEKIFPEHKNNPFYQSFYDDVVNNITLIDNDEIEVRKDQINEIVKTYQTVNISSEQIDELARVKSTKWGNLSFKFLKGVLFDDGDGELRTMIETLKDTNLNMMEILYKGENQTTIDKLNNKEYDLSDSNSLHEYLKTRYISPQARRTIIQANLIIDEIIKIMGGEKPTRISIEFTREDDAKKEETKSRMQQLSDIYKTLKLEHSQAELELEHLRTNKEEDKLKSKKVYLYFLQLGKDLYTGKPIDFDLLMSNSKAYDIDHIFPQSRIKDDSFDNLVLTSSVINGEKNNIYPLPKEVQNQNKDLWDYLVNKNLISRKKYERLTRITPLTDFELEDFINRQKTTLDWINLEIANIFDIKYNDNKDSSFIIYSKSRHISSFRREFTLLKFRELNDFHHAHDAYLNIVVGKLIQKNLYINSEGKFRTYNYERIIKNMMKENIDYIKKIFKHHDILVTKKTSINSQGAYWDQNIVAPKDNGKNEGYAPIKNSLSVDEYGGYNGVKTAFFAALKINNKIVLEAIPTVDCGYFYDEKTFNIDKFRVYINKNFPKAEIIEPIIPIGQKVLLDGVPLRISGKSKNSILFHNSSQFVLDSQSQEYLRKIFTIQRRYKGKKIEESVWIDSGFTQEKNIVLFNKIHSKLNTLYVNGKLYSDHTMSKINGEGNTKDIFANYFLIEQIQSLITILTKLLKANSSNQGRLFNVTYVDMPRSKVIKDSLSIIKESVTGFYTKTIDINV